MVLCSELGLDCVQIDLAQIFNEIESCQSYSIMCLYQYDHLPHEIKLRIAFVFHYSLYTTIRVHRTMEIHQTVGIHLL